VQTLSTQRQMRSLRAWADEVTTPAVTRRGRVVAPGAVSDEMRALIDALNKGDEETIKGLLLQTHVYH
jgi:hypothetical protein